MVLWQVVEKLAFEVNPRNDVFDRPDEIASFFLDLKKQILRFGRNDAFVQRFSTTRKSSHPILRRDQWAMNPMPAPGAQRNIT
jgi:hypothetical protein